MTAAEKQRRYRERRFGKTAKAAAAETIELLQAHIRELEADRAADHAAMENFGHRLNEVCERLGVPKLSPDWNQKYADARRWLRRELKNRLRRMPKELTGYQPACDWLFGSVAQRAEMAGRAKPHAGSKRPVREKRARATRH